MKRIIALLLAAVILGMFGCENVEYIEETSKNSQNESSVPNVYDELQSIMPPVSVPSEENSAASGSDSSSDVSQNTPIATERQPFVIVTDDAQAFYQSETAPSAISAALEERNTFLRDVYGAEITVIEEEFDVICEQLEIALENGTEYCDMISVSAENTVRLYEEGLLADMASLPDFDLDNGLFNADWSKTLATNNSVYMIADPSTLVYDETYVMFYNRDLVSEETVEKLAMQGDWTWAKLDEYARSAAEKVYTSSAADVNTDIFGFGAYYLETVYPLAMWASCDNALIDNTYKNPVAVTMDREKIISDADYLFEFFNVKGRFPFGGEDAQKAFEEGRMAFFCNKLSYFYALRDSDAVADNYGFLPMPKFDVLQEDYCSLLSNEARVISVPATVADNSDARKQFVASVITALCAAGGETITDAYINAQLAVYLNDNEELVILEMICDSAMFDFATVFGSVLDVIAKPTINAIADFFDYGSKISSSLRQGKSAFDKYCAENFT